MCGIAGIYRLDGSVADDDDGAMAIRMAQRLRHRGPDGAGILVSGSAALAHTRLALFDLTAAGTQPLIDEALGLAIIVNGTFHNAPDLRARETLLGATFRTGSDSEVLLALWKRLGTALLSELRGPFAFALYDSRRRSLFLARDRLGEKPLYLSEQGGRLLFASELGALVHEVRTRRLDNVAALEFLQSGYTRAPSTLVEGVQSLPPASWRLFEPGRSEGGCYWTPRPITLKENRRESKETTAIQLLREAVYHRTTSERSLGVLLSGGVDSAVVLSLALEFKRDIQSFTMGFEFAADEREAAAETARRLGSRHRSFLFDADPAQILRDLLKTTGEPLGDPSFLATSLLVQEAAPHATILLSGDGADEALLGYRRHGAARLANSRLLDPIGRLARALHFGESGRKPAAFLSSLGLGAVPALASLEGLAPLERIRGLLKQGDLLTPLERSLSALPREKDGAAHAGLLDLMSYLPFDLLPKSDRAAMRHGAEIWSPFLDHVVIGHLLSIPARRRRNARVGKLPLRNYLVQKIGRKAAFRKKTGFGTPVGHWLREGTLGNLAKQILGDQDAIFASLLAERSAAGLFRRFQEGERDLAPFLYACVVLALFCDLHGVVSAPRT